VARRDLLEPRDLRHELSRSAHSRDCHVHRSFVPFGHGERQIAQEAGGDADRAEGQAEKRPEGTKCCELAAHDERRGECRGQPPTPATLRSAGGVTIVRSGA
jgi:hypothetical protein